MLDIETKRRIDACRDILVGKVPDPKSQVEQVTIALIYKFMDDMDAESEELGAKRVFFADGFARYSWGKLMAPGQSGQQMLNLYAEAIARMHENEGVPELFRDIFRNAYLPYRDPETLRAFLKEINGFRYDHSERLGDAFEYLLSVLGAQGDVGSFRTPRHIIDFLVGVMDPHLHDRILDPACGTAGFLISAYKHILKANQDKQGKSTLTPDQRRTLVESIQGYDISPDMVRLSLVNLYLHGFPKPQVEEYDTLTSETHWTETFDLILANPPFMSPKGGIRPHRRFGLTSNRSEVLFVNYIAEHLRPQGRAAIIVPEGVIFQSGTAYRALRKQLVQQSLVAVVSLPAGVFQPYSGVKTSVLILDRSLSKPTGEVLFVKIQHDGYSLGAQRRETVGSELPAATAQLRLWFDYLRDGHADPAVLAGMHRVAKSRLGENGDWNLSGERYREEIGRQLAWPTVRIGEVCDINPSVIEPTKAYPNQKFNYIDISCIENGTGKFLGANEIESSNAPSRARRQIQFNDILLSTVRPNLKAFTILKTIPEKGIASTGFAVLRSKQNILPDFLLGLLRADKTVEQMIAMAGRGAYPSVNQQDVASIEIPLPPLSVQQEITTEIVGYQRVIEGAKQVLASYQPHVAIDESWPMVTIGEATNLINGRAFNADDWQIETSGGYPIIRIQNLNNQEATFNYYVGQVNQKHLIEPGTLLFSWSGSRGTSFGPHIWRRNQVGVLNQHIFKVEHSDDFDRTFLYLILKKIVAEVEDNLHGGVGLVHITKGNLEAIKIPLPDLDTQRAIVAEIEAEQRLVAANRELITRMEARIRAAIGRVWGAAQPAAPIEVSELVEA